MDRRTSLRVHNASALIAITSLLFYLFFQVSKGAPFRDINPFGSDPYDAVGSIAVQVALLVACLSYARALRLYTDKSQAGKAPLILHGNLLVLAAVYLTLCADVLAELLQPADSSLWGRVLLAGLLGMFALATTCLVVLVLVFKTVGVKTAPGDLTPADGIDDLWVLIRLPVSHMSAYLPSSIVAWVSRFDSDWLFRRAPGIDPRRHPWRFAASLGLLAGLGLILVQLQEGLPPDLLSGMLLVAIFLSVELLATLLGFAVLGGYLGLRPSFRRRGG